MLVPFNLTCRSIKIQETSQICTEEVLLRACNFHLYYCICKYCSESKGLSLPQEYQIKLLSYAIHVFYSLYIYFIYLQLLTSYRFYKINNNPFHICLAVEERVQGCVALPWFGNMSILKMRVWQYYTLKFNL